MRTPYNIPTPSPDFSSHPVFSAPSWVLRLGVCIVHELADRGRRHFLSWPWSTHNGGAEHGVSHGILPCRDKRVRGHAMRNTRMSTRTRVSIFVIVPALSLWFSGPGPASAEPSAECRDLAVRFANAAAGLDMTSLAGLMACVSAEIQNRTGGTAPAPPPGPPQEAPPVPAPAQPPSPPPTRERGQWPAPAPWGGAWPQAAPWDR